MHILWFRRDLRLEDNEIVTLATVNQQAVLPCFIIDPWFYQHSEVGQARVRFLFESLENLDSHLQKRGSRLYLFEGHSVTILEALTSELLQQGERPKLFFNKEAQVTYGIERDRQIVQFYQELNLDYYQGLNNFLQTDGDDRQRWYDEYYAYQRAPQHSSPAWWNTPQLSLSLPQLSFEQLKHKYNNFWQTGQVDFPGGATTAQATVDSFLRYRHQGYHWKLARPMLAQLGATSHLSPHLVFGTISTRNVYQQTKARAAELTSQPKAEFALKAFRDRLRWRDSFTQRLYFHPQIAYQNRYQEFDEYYCANELDSHKQELFTAWQEGQTGFPLLDASMRQLKTMGWMNFRMRAMCATFLTINCGISWHHGARHYMNYLVDGDIAINHWQWQMQSGITNPLSETFRIYNPNKNIQEKDSGLQFINYWVTELRGYGLPELLEGAYIGRSSYPAPILDWNETRKKNGLIVSNLRKRVLGRLEKEQTQEYENAVATKTAVDKYREATEKLYRDYQEKLAGRKRD